MYHKPLLSTVLLHKCRLFEYLLNHLFILHAFSNHNDPFSMYH